MPVSITTYRVFIATPGGLAAERELFRNVVRSYNESEATPRGVQFAAIGWEDTLPGRGRPQGVINSDLEDCDYCIVVLWDRWGSAPSERGPHSSGTEEEFDVAMRCAADESRPMRDVVVFFKSVDERQLSDPGPQLTRVLDFRKRLEQERQLLFDTFGDSETLAEKLRRLLGRWLRQHELSRSGTAASLPMPAAALPIGEPAAGTEPEGTQTSEFRKARTLAENGRMTEAEELWARLVTTGNDARTLRAYATFLCDYRRFREAEAPIRKALALDEVSGDEQGIAEDLLALGRQHRLVKRWEDADAVLADAVTRFTTLHDESGVIRALLERAMTRLGRGDVAMGAELCRDALERARAIRDPALEADAALNRATALHALGRKEEAEQLYASLHDRPMTPRQRGRVHYGLAVIRYARGALAEAEADARKALQLADEARHPLQRADARIVLAFVLARNGDALRAASLAQEAIELARDTEFVETNFHNNVRSLIGKVAATLPDAAKGLTTLLEGSAWQGQLKS